MNAITTKQAWGLLRRAANTGNFPHFAYILGAHALARIGDSKERGITCPVTDFYGECLVDDDGALVAGYVDDGMGVRPRGTVSGAFIEALQVLHVSGIVITRFSAPLSRPIPVLRNASHFTCWPSLRNGVDWTEDTPLTWTLSGMTEGQVELSTRALYDISPEHTRKVAFP